MVTIKFIEHNGTEHTISAETEQSVMQAALSANIPGIDADCGGACACATCHTYIDAPWASKFSPPEVLEQDLLECALEVTSSSRLSCQLHLTEELDGLVVHLPASQ
ncbi:2Fe-2S iron-sulfur cluster binding domain-containing protein [Aestuariicella hydrocarbonica]|uniref:2Fe-2S iron-sulfur cluster binding domain-containing protein n=1 Tax=Pseudomaricurvus hydrocarbonicus TaxID=1470433 RepID=A0A9E5MI10_9GAMM|nr:2Fe-2S iron-sulfur cluster-binding protein [Aestuariicella hydrocarbonica]NHO66681.1 2Fe-2S iron-sulfur cluster binding domain-containing protein [Aestuariicella hydrocarbonica]